MIIRCLLICSAAQKNLLMVIMICLPGFLSDGESHPGDEALFVTRGRLNVHLPDSHDWFELKEKDSLFVPEGVTHRYCNYTHEPTEIIFSVVPKYKWRFIDWVIFRLA